MTVLMGAQYTIHMPPPCLLHSSMNFYIAEKTNCRIFYITLEANSRFSKETELVWGPHRGLHKPQEICLFPTHFNTSSLALPTKLSFNKHPLAQPTKLSLNTSSLAQPTKHSFNTSSLAQPAKLSFNTSSLAQPTKFSFNTSFLAQPTNHFSTNSLAQQPTQLSCNRKVILHNRYNFNFNTTTSTLIIKLGAKWRWLITMSSLKCRQICLSGYL